LLIITGNVIADLEWKSHEYCTYKVRWRKTTS